MLLASATLGGCVATRVLGPVELAEVARACRIQPTELDYSPRHPQFLYVQFEEGPEVDCVRDWAVGRRLVVVPIQIVTTKG
jgi:hypothetical protein